MKRKKSRRSYYLAWTVIISLLAFLGTWQILAAIEVAPKGWHREPVFWVGALFWSTLGYFHYEVLNWLKKQKIVVPVIICACILALARLARIGHETGEFTTVVQLMMWTGAAPVMATVRAFVEEGFMGKGGRKSRPSERRKSGVGLRVTRGGSDQPWPGGWIYRLRKPILRFYIRGFNEDLGLLSKAMRALTNGANMLFCCPFEPQNCKPETFERTIEFASELDAPYEVYMEKHGMLKRLLTGEGESIGELAVDCSRPEVLDWILDHFWTGDFCCWFLAHEGDFESVAERMHQLLNPETFPQGFKELVLDCHVFMRDVEEGGALEIITANLTREYVQQRISILNAQPG